MLDKPIRNEVARSDQIQTNQIQVQVQVRSNIKTNKSNTDKDQNKDKYSMRYTSIYTSKANRADKLQSVAGLKVLIKLLQNKYKYQRYY